MKTTINDIINFFEEFAPLASQMDFDNAGLLVGSGGTSVTKALLALDITNDVVLEAENLGCELIISHHPVIFNPIKHLAPNDTPYLLAQKGIAALCMHTNLDLGKSFGVNICLANAVGAKNPKLSDMGECMFSGELEDEIDMEAFARLVKSRLDCRGLRYTAIKKTVKKVAVSSGAGGSNVFAAARTGADVLLTGEIKHHEILAANALGLNIIDAGHFKTENVVISPLAQKLSERFADVEFTESAVCDDKIRFA